MVVFAFFSLSELFVIAGFLFILSALFIGIEVGFDLVVLGSILLLSGFTGIFTDNYIVSLITAVVLTIIYFFIGRKKLKSKMSSATTHKTNTDKLVGHTGVVVKDISKSQPGRVKVDDEEWRAVANTSIKAGETVKILAIKGVSVVVQEK